MLFISHKTEDKAAAEDLKQRALRRGYADKQIFLDSDPGAGIEAGAEWERKIYESLKHTRAMIVLCSPNWLKSQWCFIELGYAKAMAISLFPILIEKCDVGSTLSATQAIDLTTAQNAAARDAAFERLWTALEERHLRPDNLPWPPPGEPDPCPFPGLMCFDEKHSPVFFGREQERGAVIQRLKEMRGNGLPRLLMIVGGSGSGKSSLLRAGVLPWLRHPTEQRDWLVLPPLRYGETPNDDVTLLARLAEIIAARFPPDHSRRPDWKELRNKFESDDIEQAARDFVDATVDLWQATHTPLAPTTDAPTVLLPIDQFEELLTAAARPSALKFLRFLRTLLSRSNGRLLIVGTMRSDYLDVYEQHAESLKPPFLELYRLPPFPWERVAEVIVKPAERVDVTFTEELITRLKGDAPNSDALPLLAFTLEKLFRQCASDNLVELREYEQLGGMTGAISQAVARILPQSMPKETEHALRLSFVKHLAQVNEKDEFVRRPARWSELPAAAKPLLEQFVRERLLHRSGTAGELIEVSHEALFRFWDQLTKWLNESSRILRWRRDVEHDRKAAADSWTGITRSQLAVARKWPKERPDELSPGETKWIKRRILFERSIMGSIGAVVLLVTGLWLWSLHQTNIAVAATKTADDKTKEVERKKLEVENEKRNVQQVGAASLLNSGHFAIQHEHDLRKALIWYGQAAITAEPGSAQRRSALKLIGSWGTSLPIHSLVHDGPVTKVVFSRDGRSLATASGLTARLWDVATGKPHGEPFRHDQDVLDVTFSRDGQTLVTASKDKMARLWNVATREARELQHEDAVLSVAFNPNGDFLATASNDGKVRLWEWEAGKPPVKTLDHEGKPVRFMMFSPGGDVLATFSHGHLSSGGHIELWDVATGKLRNEQIKDEGWSWSFEFSTDWQNLATVEVGGKVQLRHPKTGEPLDNPLKHESSVSSIAFHPDGYELATASRDGTVRCWLVPTGELITTMRHENVVNSIAYSPTGNVLATASDDHTVRVWSQRTEPKMFDVGGIIRSLRFSTDGSALVTASNDMLGAHGTAHVLNLTTGTRINFPVSDFFSSVISVDGKMLAIVANKKIQIWDVATGNQCGEFPQQNDIAHLAFSADGKMLASTNNDKEDSTVQLWNVAKPNGHPQVLFHGESSVVGLGFSTDGKTLATASLDKKARLWNTSDGELSHTLLHQECVHAVAFSQDGRLLAAACNEETVSSIWLWDVDKRTLLRKLPHSSHDALFHSLAFSTDGTTLALGTSDQTTSQIYLWDVATGKPLCEPSLGGAPIAFSADGCMLATASGNQAQLWGLPPPAEDEPERLWLSIEVRTWHTFENGLIRPLTHKEWRARRTKLDALGGPCDVRSISPAERAQLRQPPRLRHQM